MAIPKNYFQDRLVLLLISFNFFFAAVTSILILFRLGNSNAEGIVSQYHANLGLSAYRPGSTSTFVSFIVFVAFVFLMNTMLSMRMYHRRRDFSIAVLWMGLLLLILALIVSNALSVLQ
jgi:hypothetical protein